MAWPPALLGKKIDFQDCLTKSNLLPLPKRYVNSLFGLLFVIDNDEYHATGRNHEKEPAKAIQSLYQ